MGSRPPAHLRKWRVFGCLQAPNVVVDVLRNSLSSFSNEHLHHIILSGIPLLNVSEEECRVDFFVICRRVNILPEKSGRRGGSTELTSAMWLILCSIRRCERERRVMLWDARRRGRQKDPESAPKTVSVERFGPFLSTLILIPPTNLNLLRS